MKINSQTSISLKVNGKKGEYSIFIPMGSNLKETVEVLQHCSKFLLALEEKQNPKEKPQNE